MGFSNKKEQERYYADMLRHINHNGECAAHNNIELTRVDEDYAEGVLHVKPESLNYIGAVHGGCLAILADTIAGVAACSRGRGCVTVNYAFNFLRQARGGTIKCVATPVKVGKTLSVFRVELTDDEGTLVSAGDFTFHLTGDLIQWLREK